LPDGLRHGSAQCGSIMRRIRTLDLGTLKENGE
jgi:hypothetical protein